MASYKRKKVTTAASAEADNQQIDFMRMNYGPRAGLEGPFNFSGRVLYYDSSAGQYYDPRTDWYIDNDEMNMILYRSQTNNRAQER